MGSCACSEGRMAIKAGSIGPKMSERKQGISGEMEGGPLIVLSPTHLSILVDF